MKALRFSFGLLFSVLCPLSSVFAAGSIISGPMLGYRAHREVFLWVETKDAQKVTLDYWLAGQPGTKRTLKQTNPAITPAGGQIIHFRPGLLEMGAKYEYTLSLDGVKQTFPFPTTFQTQGLWEWRTPPPDFKFIVGSCAYINDPAYDRPGAPYGKTTRTFELMGDSGADFMVWLGDNWYYRESDYDSISGLWYRPQHDRAIPEMRKLLASMHHYATWDDHDYGPNDSNWSYEFKDETLKIFRAYWGNPSYGEQANPGVYTKFTWGDAAFFMMDNQFHRDAALNQDTHLKKTQWGRRQLEWLKQSLLQAKELKHFTFMFIVTGGQVITNFGGASETFAYYPEEREELLRFIVQHHITGVIFLSGDVHFTELARKKITDTQWVYELTSSPLSAGFSTLVTTERIADPHRVDGTLVDDQNFSVVSITGPTDDRSVVFSCIDQQGVVRFTRTIKATELQ